MYHQLQFIQIKIKLQKKMIYFKWRIQEIFPCFGRSNYYGKREVMI